SQWAPELVRDNTQVDPPRTPEEGYHLTEDLVDESIRMIQDQQQAEARKPFFLHLATGAAHAPHQVTEEWVEPYYGRFDNGWEAWREEVFANQVASGVVPADTVLTERPEWVPEWSSIPAEQRRLFARYMEVYAGFVTHTDHHLGRLFDAIEVRGIADDTIIMVLSDNGASAEGGVHGTLNEAAGWLGVQEDVEASMERIDEIGGHDAYNHYPFGWAWAGNTPLRLWKRYAWLGGVRTPLVLRWGAKVTDPGAIRGQFCHAVDIFSTILDAAGIAAPDAVDGVTQQPVDGTSMLASIAGPGGADAPEHRGLQYFEMMGSRGIYADGWKAVTDYVPNQFGERETLTGSFDFASDAWSLFRLVDDFSEAIDVSAEHPEVVKRLEELWWAEAGRNQVLPLFEFPDSMAHMHPGAFPAPVSATYTPGGGPIQESQLPSTMGGFDLTAEIVVPEGGADGILAAIGDAHGGWGCYLLEGRLVAAFAMLDGLVRVACPEPLAPGTHQVSVQYVGGRDPHARLLVAGVEQARVVLPGFFFFPNLSTSATGMLIGRDRGLALCRDYAPPFAFTGELRRVTITSGSPGAQADSETLLRAALASD
ncbi:MAG: sulfatase-like hydrolase/transferase, partial [Nocardioides sp.]